MLKYSEKNWIKVASGLGVIQGITWFILSLICVVYHLKSFQEFDLSETNFASVLSYSIYLYFLNRPHGPLVKLQFPDHSVVNPTCFTIFCWIHTLSSLVWILISIKQLLTMMKNHSNVPKWLKRWSYATYFVSAVDLLFTILLGLEYNRCVDNMKIFSKSVYSRQEYCVDVVMTITIISARGFTLWIVNVAIATVVGNLAKNIQMRSS